MQGYATEVTSDLIMVTISQVQQMNHLMVMESADQIQIVEVIVAPKMVTRTGSLTRKIIGSQSQNWKFGKSQRWLELIRSNLIQEQ